VKLTPARVANSDCVVIATDHSSLDYKMIKDRAKLLVDTRGVYHRLKMA
jgi:UDP-N-acetyl-D-glucosamine dehydrogenase